MRKSYSTHNIQNRIRKNITREANKSIFVASIMVKRKYTMMMMMVISIEINMNKFL